MIDSSEKRRLSLRYVALAVAVAGLVGVLLWGGLQSYDPLSAYVYTDSMRHMIGFSTLGLCAAFVPGLAPRMTSLGAAFVFAAVFELVQKLFSTRQMEFSDLVASSIGIFAGYGVGTATLSMLDLARQIRDRLFGAKAATSA